MGAEVLSKMFSFWKLISNPGAWAGGCWLLGDGRGVGSAWADLEEGWAGGWRAGLHFLLATGWAEPGLQARGCVGWRLRLTV